MVLASAPYDLLATQLTVAALCAVAGLCLFGALLIGLQRAMKKWPAASSWRYIVMGVLGAAMICGLILQPMLKRFGPGAEFSQHFSEPKWNYVSSDAPVLPRRTTFTPEEIETARRIANTWDGAAAILFFGGLVGCIYGAVRAWRLRYIWLVTAVGMVGGYIIWDFVILGALHFYQPGIYRQVLPKDFGDQPGVVAAFFGSFFWAFMMDCLADGVRSLRRAWSRSAGPTPST
jgi:hypothetical protein